MAYVLMFSVLFFIWINFHVAPLLSDSELKRGIIAYDNKTRYQQIAKRGKERAIGDLRKTKELIKKRKKVTFDDFTLEINESVIKIE